MSQGSNPVVCLYLRKVDVTGTPVYPNFFFLGEVPDINFSVPDDIVSYQGNTCETVGLTVGSMPVPGEADGTIATLSVNSKTVGMMYGVEPEEVVYPGSTLTAEPITTAWKYGDWIPIGKENLDDDIMIQDAGDAITYTKGVQYKLNEFLGMVMFPSTAETPVTESSEFHVSGTELARTIQSITIKKGDIGFYEVLAKSKNRIGGETVKDHLLCCRVVANSSRVIGVEAGNTDRTRIEFKFIPQVPEGGNSYGVIDGLPKMVGA